MQLMQFKPFVLIVLLATLANVISGCSPRSPDASDKSRQNLATAATDQSSLQAPSQSPWPKEIRKEVWNDPQLLKEERILFAAAHEGSDRKSAWSMRLDGSDTRMVLDAADVYGGSSLDDVTRSPNRRYIAFRTNIGGPGFSGLVRVVYDLETKEVIMKVPSGGRPRFSWSSDSEELYFMGDKDWTFNVNTKKLTERARVRADTVHMLPSGSFLAQHSRYFEIYSIEGELKKTMPITGLKPDLVELFGSHEEAMKQAPGALDYWIGEFYVTPDKKKYVFKTGGSLPVLIIWGSVDTGETEGTILADTLCLYPRVFVLDNNSKIGCISRSYTSIEYLDLKTKVLGKYDLAEPGIWGISSFDVRGTQLPIESE